MVDRPLQPWKDAAVLLARACRVAPILPALLAAVIACWALASAPASRSFAVADQGLRSWLQGADAGASGELTPEGLGRSLSRLTRFAPVPAGAAVLWSSQRLLTRRNGLAVFRYHLQVGLRVQPIDVLLRRKGRVWKVRRIRFVHRQPIGLQLPTIITQPWAGWVFAGLSLLLLFGLRPGGRWRKLCAEGLQVAMETKTVFWLTNALLYGVFILGMLAAYAQPALALQLQRYVGSLLGGVGLNGLIQGTVPQTALGIFLWNFSVGSLLTTFLPGLLFGVPALLINLFRLLILGVALSPRLIPLAVFLVHIPTMLVELEGYFFVVALGMGLLWRLPRVGAGRAFAGYLRAIPVSLTLLLCAAWYEAFEVLVLIPRLR